jgi:predicted transcriptional regulator of viral defense system
MPLSDVDVFGIFRPGPCDWVQAGAIDWVHNKGIPSFFRPDQLQDFGIRPDNLRTLILHGAVERICRGIYHVVGDEPSPHWLLAIASLHSPGSIVCLHSALKVHDIHSTASAPTVWLAIPHGARTPRLPELSLRIVRFSGTAGSFDVTWTEFDGVPARITTPARTVADCFRLERLAGAGAGVEALRDALGRGLVTLEQLARIEGALPCRPLRDLLAAAQVLTIPAQARSASTAGT